MDGQPNLSPQNAPGRYQFRLGTLFVVTTIFCLHFAVAAYAGGTALALSVFSVGVTLIFVARTRFALLPAAAGASAIFGLPIFAGAIFATLAIIDLLTPQRPGEPPSLGDNPQFAIFMTFGGVLLGLIAGFCIAVGYWVIVGIRIFIRPHSKQLAVKSPS